jgi:glycosyltransferase involved in cell wall biosynthesis
MSSKHDPSVFEVLVESSGLFPPLSGVGYYSRELLKAYALLPGHLPVRVLAYRFFLRSGPGPQEAYLAGLARELDGRLEVRRRLAPGPFFALLRELGLRPPVPLDLGQPRTRCLYFFPNYIGEPLLRAACVPVVYDFSFLRYPHSLRGRDHLYLKRYLPRTLRQARRVVVISACMKSELQRAYGTPAEKISIIPPAANSSVFKPDIPPRIRQAVRKRYGLAGDYIFSLGTLEPRKNFSRLIEAFALLPAPVRKRTVLAIAGGPGWKNEDIFRSVHRLNLDSRVKFLGYISEADRAPLMREAVLFALPALYEGFGMPVLEAMACGTPVVTSDRGALPEVGGEAVIYADPFRPESISRGLLSVIENAPLRARLSKAGISRASSFTWARSAGMLAEVFARAAAEA